MIRYNDAGLRNVWLENGYQEEHTAYGKGLVIDDIEGLPTLLLNDRSENIDCPRRVVKL